MQPALITSIAFLALAICCVPTSHAITFDFALVDNAGNAPDAETGFGAVAYNYSISKTEVTNAQYTNFLNAVDPVGANSLSLYNADQADMFGGIVNTGATDGAHYIAQAGRENNPVTFVSWYDSVRFVNWLHNGQGSGDTETGAYTLLGGTTTPSNGLSITRNPSATFWLPSEDEWYKAAYHDALSGTAGAYFDYATGSDTVPVSNQPGDDSGAVNYFNDDGVANGFNDGYSVSGSISVPSNPFTEVGAFTTADSPYGTFDQAGNVFEWNESLVNSSFRVVRGGSWGSNALSLQASGRIIRNAPTLERKGNGFRVASIAIPEPTTLSLAALGLLTISTRRRRP